MIETIVEVWAKIVFLFEEMFQRQRSLFSIG